jgi:hypothetical protein
VEIAVASARIEGCSEKDHPAEIVVLALAIARVRVIVLTLVAYLLAHACVPHKELRFLMPIAPLWFALAGGGLAWLASRLRFGGWAAIAIAVAVGAQFALSTRDITFADMGQYTHEERGARPPWHHDEGPNLAFWAAGEHDDLCGMILLGTPFYASGGYSYLHKNVPMMIHDSPAYLASGNYVALPRSLAAPVDYRVIETYPDYVLAKRSGMCVPPPPGVAEPTTWAPQ